MSKKIVRKNKAPESVVTLQPTAEASVSAFGYDEMLTELEAIVADAATRLAEEDEAA
ncbi:hypothetical protein [Phytobacter sp. V91]|uniref:hypothetical protein n=1 Tax=Phytobacter sp. V91 TaxID=3369425 RepID=UPI003F630834